MYKRSSAAIIREYKIFRQGRPTDYQARMEKNLLTGARFWYTFVINNS